MKSASSEELSDCFVLRTEPEGVDPKKPAELSPSIVPSLTCYHRSGPWESCGMKPVLNVVVLIHFHNLIHNLTSLPSLTSLRTRVCRSRSSKKHFSFEVTKFIYHSMPFYLLIPNMVLFSAKCPFLVKKTSKYPENPMGLKNS